MSFNPTHVITVTRNGFESSTLVERYDDILYTRVEVEACVNADWTFEDGNLLFQGGLPRGCDEYGIRRLDPGEPRYEVLCEEWDENDELFRTETVFDTLSLEEAELEAADECRTHAGSRVVYVVCKVTGGVTEPLTRHYCRDAITGCDL